MLLINESKKYNYKMLKYTTTDEFLRAVTAILEGRAYYENRFGVILNEEKELRPVKLFEVYNETTS